MMLLDMLPDLFQKNSVTLFVRYTLLTALLPQNQMPWYYAHSRIARGNCSSCKLT